MKHSTLILLIAIPLAFIAFTASVDSSAHSPGGKTGSPLDGATCTQCHTGSPQSVTGWISTDIPMEGYQANGEYMITLTATHAGVVKMGFELTAENSSGQKTGTFATFGSSETELTNGGSAVTHNSGGTTPTGDTRTWQMIWTAPDEDQGSITFYAAVNAANGNGNTSGDVIYNTSHVVNYNPLSINSAESRANKVYPNPANNFITVDLNKAKHLDVLDFSGKVVKSVDMTSASEKIDISDLESGTYFIQSEDETERIIKL
jgi:hypothetical protein